VVHNTAFSFTEQKTWERRQDYSNVGLEKICCGMDSAGLGMDELGNKVMGSLKDEEFLTS
jgi:hypothetical protein